jgi:hypothetical protein
MVQPMHNWFKLHKLHTLKGNANQQPQGSVAHQLEKLYRLRLKPQVNPLLTQRRSLFALR